MKKKKNKFLLFVFSLWPGAGHMYIGFMKTGLSFMLGFLLSCVVVGITNIGAFAAVSITIYVYAFFHANNIGSLDDEQFAAMEDEYLFGIGQWDFSRFKLDRKNRNIAAVVCIVLGISMLWDVGFGMLRDYVGADNPVIRAIYYTMRDEVPRVIIALAVIWFGVSLMRGKKNVDARMDAITQKEAEDAGREAQVHVEMPVVQIEQKHEKTGGENEGQTDRQKEA